MMNRLLVTAEVARILRVSDEFVRRVIRGKKLRAYKEGKRGGYRVREQDVEEYVRWKLAEEEAA